LGRRKLPADRLRWPGPPCRRSRIHRSLGLSNLTGLSQVFLNGTGGLDGSVQSAKINNLFVLTAGELPPNPSELLGSQKMGAILEELKALSEIVLIDTPPTLAVTDAAVLVPFVDGVLLVMKPGQTHLAAARQIVEQFRRLKANLLGVVLNNVDLHRSSYGYYYNQYTYADTKKKSKKQKDIELKKSSVHLK
jgi:capsular exopolysaccharide synthesis family protein